MAHIAAFSVLLESDASPCDATIKKMNYILGYYHNSQEQVLDPITPQHHKASCNEFPSILVPVVARFIQAEPRGSTPFQEWTKMHLSLLHASSSTMDINMAMLCLVGFATMTRKTKLSTKFASILLLMHRPH